MRDPILHIKLSDLEKVMVSLGGTKQEALYILKQAVRDKYQLKDRYFVQTKTKATEKKVQKSIDAEGSSVELFNRLLHIERKARFSTSPPILKNSKDYTLLKEISLLAHQFTMDWEIGSIDEGYKKFIDLGMDLMGKKYALNKYKYYLTKIYDIQECVTVIKGDSQPEQSEKFKEQWTDILSQNSTMVFDVTDPMDYMHIIYGRQEADEAGADYKDWIQAQFDQMSFLETMPELHQLYGINSRKRYEKYMTNKGKRKEPLKEDTGVYNSRAEADYFKRLREKRAENENNNK